MLINLYSRINKAKLMIPVEPMYILYYITEYKSMNENKGHGGMVVTALSLMTGLANRVIVVVVDPSQPY